MCPSLSHDFTSVRLLHERWRITVTQKLRERYGVDLSDSYSCHPVLNSLNYSAPKHVNKTKHFSKP